MTDHTPIVIQLQELAADSKNNISDLLRKALLISTKLNLNDFRSWVSNELNGYEDCAQVPEYRRLMGQLKAHNPFHGYIPFIIQSSRIMNLVQEVIVTESIESLQHLVKTSQKSDIITYPFPPEQEAYLMSLQNRFEQMRPTRVIGISQLAAILEKVRTHLLDWSLNLESAGILGENLTFSKEEKKKAEISPIINISHFQGILGDVHGGSVSQAMSMTITSGNFDSLAKYLNNQGVSTQDIKDLEEAIQKDPTPSDKGQFGNKVSKWIGKMVGKAADGSWKIGIAAAGNLLATAIGKYYGL